MKTYGTVGLSQSRRTVLVGVVFLLTVAAGCATSPLGRTQVILYSDRDMRAMGEAAFDQMKMQVPEASAPGTSEYVRCVASTITRTLGDRSTAWDVVVFDDDQVNAFALPGGKIGVYRGMLEVAETQEQLAAVIGHEIGHLQARHANERVSTSTLAQAGMQVVGAISGGPSPARDSALAALGLGVQVGVLLPFSRTQETEADLIGLDLMASAGFDPQAAVTLWRNMAKSKGRAPQEFLSTHPASGTRIDALRERMPQALELFSSAREQGRRPNCRQ